MHFFLSLNKITLEQSIKQISVLISSFCSVHQRAEASRSPAELWQILFPPADVKASTFPYIQRSFIMDSLWKLKQASSFFFFSGHESARVNGFSILLFIKREYLSSTPCDVKVQSVIPSERSAGTHRIDSVAPQNPKGITCVCPLCSETSSGIWH